MPHKAALSVFMKPGPRQRVKRALWSEELLDLERQAGDLRGSETSLRDMLTAGIGPCHHHLVAKSCPTLCDPMNCSPPGSSVHEISQARILEWIAISSCNRPLFSSVQFSSVTQSCPTLCDPMNPSTPGLPVHHHLPEFTQTRIHRVSDAIQPSHPLSSPSPPAPNPSQHQSLCQ